MRFRLLLTLSVSLLLAATSAAAHETNTTAAPAYRAVVNGQELPNAYVHQGRIYVPASSFAQAISGRLTLEGGVYRITTGSPMPTVAELTALNPALRQYKPLSPFIPGMGIHIGVEGPGIVLAISKEGTLNAAELIVPAGSGWQPWFDQPENQPTELPGLGMVYTQHIYVTPSEGLVEQGAGVPVIIDGRYLSSGYELKGHLKGDTLYIPLRTAVDLLGGSIGWDPSTMTATAVAQSDGIRYDWLQKLNPALTTYEALSPFVPNMGVHWGVPGPHLTVMTDTAGKVTGFELLMPAAAGWFPWYDQPEGQPFELPGLGQVYSQHIYLVEPATIR